MKTKHLRNVIIAIALVLAGALGTYLLIGSDEEKTEQNVPVNKIELADKIAVAKLKKDTAEVFRLYYDAAQRGDVESQYHLGVCYYSSEGVELSREESVKWFRKAAEQGYADAQYMCGALSESEEDVAKWYYRAAEQGHTVAQTLLGMCYEEGYGVAQSYDEAEKWYRKAAEQGVEEAKQALEELENERKAKTAEQKRKEEERLAAERHRQKSVKKETPADGIKAYELGDYATAFRIFKENADDNYIAQYYLGLCYFNGQGVEESKTEAARLYRKAAECGYIYAQYSLGHYYIVYTTDEEEGVKWYTMAAERGHIGAQIGLGLYMKRTDNWSAAIKWMTRAAEAGHAYAQFLLGQMYETGNPTADYAFRKANGLEEETISITDAVKWYRKSANQGNESAKEALKRLGY